MKIAVFGATGPTGVHIVKQALEKGYTVRALVRNPEKMASLVQNDNLEVHKVDIKKEDELTGPLTGVDAVLSALGGEGGMFAACSIYTDSIKSITAAMRKVSVKRIVCCTSWGAKEEPGLPFVIVGLRKTFLRTVLRNMGEMEDFLLENCSDLTYTAVKPPRLLDDPLTDKELSTREGQYVENVTNAIGRADVAKFMLNCLTTDAYDNKLIAVGPAK